MEKAGRSPEGKPYTLKTIVGFVTSWKTLLFTLIFMIQPFGSQPFTAFVFWLKAHNKKGKPPVYTIAQIVSGISYDPPGREAKCYTYNDQQNQYPTIGNAFTAVYSLTCVWISDGPLKGRRWPVILFSNMIAIVVFVLLVVTPVMGPFSHRAPLYIVASIGGSMVPLTMAWMAELISDNAEQRAFTAASMNTLQCKQTLSVQIPKSLTVQLDTFTAWIPLVWFQQVHQPYVTAGNRAAAVIAGVNIIVFSTIAFLSHKEKLAKARNNQHPPEPDTVKPESLSGGSDKTDELTVSVLTVKAKGIEGSGQPT
jgi:ACS family pantothenate transporter-like MFS transporter